MGELVDGYNKLLLHFDGVDGATSAIDYSGQNHAISFFDDAQIDTAQYKFAPSSVLFDGTDDYLTIPDSSDWSFGTGDFTIDFWFRPVATSRMALFAGTSDQWLGIDFHRGSGIGVDRNINVWASSTGVGWDLLNADGGGNGIGAVSLALNTWHHVAFIRNGNNWRTYLNGTVDVDVNVAGALVVKAEAKRIGKWGAGFGFPLNGHLDEWRIGKGIARWTANFTPYTYPYHRIAEARVF